MGKKYSIMQQVLELANLIMVLDKAEKSKGTIRRCLCFVVSHFFVLHLMADVNILS